MGDNHFGVTRYRIKRLADINGYGARLERLRGLMMNKESHAASPGGRAVAGMT